MFYSKVMKQSISKTHKRLLDLFFLNENQLTFKDLLEKARPLAYTREIKKPWQLKFIRLRTISPLRL